MKAARRAYSLIDKEIAALEKRRAAKRTKDEERTRLYMTVIAAKQKKLDIALDVLTSAVDFENRRVIDDARSEALEIMLSYNLALDECEKLVGMKLTRAISVVCDEIICGRPYRDLPLIAYRRELVERIGERERILGYSKREEPDTSVAVVEQDKEIVEENETAANEAALAAVAAKDLAKYLKRRAKEREAAAKELESLKNAKNVAKGTTRVENIVKCLACEKDMIDGLCADVTACVQTGDKKSAKKLAASLETEIAAYNTLVDEYARLTGSRLSEASATIPACVLEGKPYPQIPHVVLRVADTAYDRADVTKVDRAELAKYIAAGDKELAAIRDRLAVHIKERDAVVGKSRIPAIVKCLGCEKSLIDKLCDHLLLAVRVGDDKAVSERRKLLSAEITAYNKLIDEYADITGSRLSYASTTIPDDIIAGRPYRGIPTVSCTVSGDTLSVGGDMQAPEEQTPVADRKAAKRAAKAEKRAAREAAENARLEAEAEEFARKQEKLAEKRGKRRTSTDQETAVGDAALGRVTLDASIREQNAKALKVITDEAGFRISMLESERDIATYRFGGNSKNSKSRLGEIKKELKLIHKRHKKALEAEAQDNERYYTVACLDVQNSDFKRKRANRQKLEKLQNKLKELLDERATVNEKLTAVYTGIGSDVEGVSVNEKWRSVKTAAAAKAYKKQRALGRKVSRLPASPNEKKQIYDLMNNKIDAQSSIALCKWRLKHEKCGRAERRKIDQEIRLNEKRVRHIDQDIKFLGRKAHARAERAHNGGTGMTVLTVLGIFALLIVGVVIFILSPASGTFGEGIRNMISGLIPPELKP